MFAVCKIRNSTVLNRCLEPFVKSMSNLSGSRKKQCCGIGHQASAKADDAEDAEHWLSEMIKEKIPANEAASELGMLGKDLLNIEKHC